MALAHVEGDFRQHDADAGHHGGDDMVAKHLHNPGQRPGEPDNQHDDRATKNDRGILAGVFPQIAGQRERLGLERNRGDGIKSKVNPRD